MKQFFNTASGQVVTLAVIAGVGVYLASRYASQKLNPNSKENIAYGSVNAVGATLTDNDNFDLGSWIYEKINGTSLEQIEHEQVKNYWLNP